MKSERFRFLAALAGVALWIGYPFFFFASQRARWVYRCGDRTFRTFDDCFNDFLPFVELIAFPLTLILLYPFCRFAFSSFAPPPEQRSRIWLLARKHDRKRRFRAFRIVDIMGLVWIALHVWSLPPDARYAGLFAYWGAWTVWFGLGMYIYWQKGTSIDTASEARDR